ncbi:MULTISPECIES: GAF domain-containing sensor histidine kinase [Desertifilum]|nr:MULTISPECIES: GAF domain-containing sensor histidine kinase [Desertifilum]MBD2331537.1 GAF domain-containing sensor histidine kinase [Desertifilum sp. FACHB-868]
MNIPPQELAMHSLSGCSESREPLLERVPTPPYREDEAFAASRCYSRKPLPRCISPVQTAMPAWIGYQKLVSQLTMAIRANQEVNRIFQLALEGLAQSFLLDRAMIILFKYSDPLNKDFTKQMPQFRASLACEWQEQQWMAIEDGDREIAGDYTFWGSDCSLCQLALREAPKPVAIAPVNRLNQISLYPLNNLPQSPIAAIFKTQDFSTSLCLPLYAPSNTAATQNTTLGFIILQNRQPRLWQSAELEFAELISAQVSSAIMQSQTLRQVQALVDERTAQLQRSLEVQAKLYEQTRRQIDQLRHLNQLKDEFVNSVQHELKTPLTKMKVAISILREADSSPERRERYLDILEQECNQEINLILDLLKLQKLESKQTQLHRQPVDLKLLIKQLATEFEERWHHKGLNLQVNFPKRSLKLQSDLESLTYIIQELLANAGKYSHRNTTVVLSASHQIDPQQADQIVLTLSNLGSEIAPAEQPYIFDKFRRGKAAIEQALPGTGLGLALVKCHIQHLEATIAVSSQPLDPCSNIWQTCFTTIFPQL